jgi:DHA1 family tetracycline resistance protein-like MFS transporter
MSDAVAAQPAPAPTLPWSSFGPILAVHFLGTLGFSLAIPFLVFIVADLGGAPWTYGLVGATYSTFQLFGAPALGRWSDRTGRRPVLLASQLGTFLAWVLFLIALSVDKTTLTEVGGATLTIPLLLVFAARALDGATGGNISVANAYVADLTKDNPEVRQLAFGRMGAAASLGFAIGPAAAGLLGGTSWGPRLPIAIAAGFAAATTVAIMVWLREPGRRCDALAAPPDLRDAGLGQQAKACDRKPAPALSFERLLFRPIMSVVVVAFLLFLAFNFFYAGFPLHAGWVFKWDAGQLGIYFAILSVMMIVAQGPLLSFLAPRVDARFLFAAGVGLLALSLLSLTLEPGLMTWVGAGLFAVGNGLSWPTFQARIAEVGGESQGSVQGAVTSASSLASILGLIVGGVLYSSLGANLFWIGAALFVFLMVATPAFFPRPIATEASRG